MEDKDYNAMTIPELEREINDLDSQVVVLRARMRHVHNVLDVKNSLLPPSQADPKRLQTIGGKK